jgi:hypothetical protein
MRTHRQISGLAATALALGFATTGLAAPPRTADAHISELGKDMVQYDGSSVRAVVSYKLAAHSLGEPWLILELGVVGKGMVWVPLERSSFALIPPTGKAIPLLSEADFQDNIQAIRATGRKAGFGQPLGEQFPAATRECNLAFFTGPDSARTALPLESVNVARVCMGPIFFHPPGGVTKGPWVLTFSAGKEVIRIPFTL